MPRPRALMAMTPALLLFNALGATAARADGEATDLCVVPGAIHCSDTGAGTRSAPFCWLQATAGAALPGQTVHLLDATSPGSTTGTVDLIADIQGYSAPTR